MQSSPDALRRIERAVVRCTRCPELRTYCEQIAAQRKRAFADWTYWAKPVPAFGDPDARVLLVGLAPGAHGSNRTGRVFTGDGSGEFLYPALHRAGFASQPAAIHRDDGLKLRDCMITAALRCAPPHNKPTPDELARCFPFLLEELRALPRLQVIVGLGAVGTKAPIAAIEACGFTFAQKPLFGHGAEAVANFNGRSITLISSFHPSRQNTNTGKLTAAMFDAIFARVKELLG